MGWNVSVPDAEYFDERSGTALGGFRLEPLIKEIEAQKVVAIDTETDGLSLWKALPYYFSMSWEDSGRERRVMLPTTTLPHFRRAFQDRERQWVFANAKFDAHMLANRGAPIAGKLVDTAVMHALLFEEQPHDLKGMVHQILGWKWTDFQATFGSLRKGTCECGGNIKSHKDGGYCKSTGCQVFRQVTALDLLERAAAESMTKLVDYASNDAYGTWKLYLELKRQLEAEETWGLYRDEWPAVKTLADYFYNIEVPFTRALWKCERNGIMVDRKYLEELSPKLLKEIQELRTAIVAEAGYMLNPNSDADLRAYFFDKLRLPVRKWTKGGKTGIKQPSVDASFLESICDEVKLADLVLQLKKLTKTHGTYVESMPGMLDPQDRVHGKLNQDVARTGRLSGSEPNLQNIPTGEKDKHGLRRSFISKPKHKLIVSDYDQLEMRLLGAAALDPSMCESFKLNRDIHNSNVALMYGLPYDDIALAKKMDKMVKQGVDGAELTPYLLDCLHKRDKCKTLGFGLNYGMKEKALARRMGTSVEEAIETTTRYMDSLPAVRRFFEEAVSDARESGFAYTILGRRRRLSDIWSTREMDRWQAERQATNLPIQGSAADVCKMAMILLDEEQLDKKLGCNMLLQVHDELIFECPDENVEEAKGYIKTWMEHPFPSELAAPLTISMGSGTSWGSAK